MDGVKSNRKYVVARCFNCHKILVLNFYAMQRKCPYCGKKVTTKAALTLRKFTSKEAAEVAKALKLKHHPQNFGLEVRRRSEKD
jgi:RNA polymerase subunit RPABC4/transcription elongation factor Spt4